MQKSNFSVTTLKKLLSSANKLDKTDYENRTLARSKVKEYISSYFFKIIDCDYELVFHNVMNNTVDYYKSDRYLNRFFDAKKNKWLSNFITDSEFYYVTVNPSKPSIYHDNNIQNQ